MYALTVMATFDEFHEHYFINEEKPFAYTTLLIMLLLELTNLITINKRLQHRLHFQLSMQN